MIQQRYRLRVFLIHGMDINLYISLKMRGFRSGIHGSLSIVGESSDIANPDTVPIVVLTPYLL